MLFPIVPLSTHPIQLSLFRGINTEVISHYPFVAYVAKRPFYFYFLNIFLINPFYLIGGFLLWKEHKKQNTLYIFLLVYIFYSLLLFSIFALIGGSFQMRYIVFIEPFIILLLSCISEEVFVRKEELIFFTLLSNLFLVFVNVYIFHSAELYSFPELYFFFR